MFELILKLLDKLVEFMKERREFNRRSFEDHVDPIYKDIEQIGRDYENAMTEMLRLANNENDLTQLIEDLRRRRKMFADVRKNLGVYSQVLRDKSEIPQEVKKFAENCSMLISSHPAEIRGRASPYTNLIADLEQCIYKGGFGTYEKGIKCATRVFEVYLHEIQLRRAVIRGSYYELRAACLK